MADSKPHPGATGGGRPQDVEFAPARVATGRRSSWTPVITVGWILVLVAVVATGLLSGPGAPASQILPTTEAPAASTDLAVRGLPGATLVPGRADVLSIAVVADGRRLAIDGSVAVRAAARVLVTVRDGLDRMLASRWVSIPQGVGIRPEHLPTFWFELALPRSTRSATLIIETYAYDDQGRIVGTDVQLVRPPPARCGAGWDCPSS